MLCFWQLLHIVLYHNTSTYCISGLNSVEQVNAHYCFVLAYPTFLKSATNCSMSSKFFIATIDNLPSLKLFYVTQVNALYIFVLALCHSVPCTGYSSISTLNHHYIVLYWYYSCFMLDF